MPAFPLQVVLALVTLDTVIVRSQGAETSRTLAQHSFDFATNATSLNPESSDMWFMFGGTVPLKSKLILQPPVTGRVGAIFHKAPVLTNDFEVQAGFKVAKEPHGDGTMPQGLAFWYLTDDPTPAFNVSYLEKSAGDNDVLLKEKGLNLFGSKDQFRGLGVFLAATKGATPKVTLSALWSEGDKRMDPSDIPAKGAVDCDWRQDFTFNARVKANSVVVTLKGADGKETTLTLDGLKVPTGGYMGFTAFSAYVADKATDHPSADGVSMSRVTTINHDLSAKGEEAVKRAKGDKKGEDGDLMADHSVHKDHRDESQAIKELTQVVFKLVAESSSAHTHMSTLVDKLSSRSTKLRQSILDVKEEIDLRSGHKLDSEFEALKRQLTQLKTDASKDHSATQGKVNALQQDVAQAQKTQQDAKVKQMELLTDLGSRHEKMHAEVKSRSSSSFFLGLVSLALVGVAGFGLYRKFGNWEKKHWL